MKGFQEKIAPRHSLLFYANKNTAINSNCWLTYFASNPMRSNYKLLNIKSAPAEKMQRPPSSSTNAPIFLHKF